MYEKADLLKQLKDIKIPKNSVVHIHSSLKSVGKINGGGDTLLDAFLDYFEDDGLVSFPAHTWAFTKNEYALDFLNPDTCVGTLSKLALKRESGVRSLHPTHSVVAFGKNADKFIKGDELSETPTPPTGCYGKLFDLNGYIMLVGVNHSANTYLHFVEENLNLPNRFSNKTYPLKIRLKDGKVITRNLKPFTSAHIGSFWEKYPKFEPFFKAFGAQKEGVLGDASVLICSAVKMKQIVGKIYECSENKELLADDNPIYLKNIDIYK